MRDDSWQAMSLRDVFSPSSRLQRYLDVEAALALTEADLGIIPKTAAEKIAASAKLECIDQSRLDAGQAITGHFMMPLVSELSRIVQPPDGEYVHWGATTQNIEQTGDVLGLRSAIHILANQLCDVLEALATLGERTADTLMAGRTHWQQAVPITFGFKVATWTDVMLRHVERFAQMKPRLLMSMTGGAVGTFASFGDLGPAVQEGVARRLNLTPMGVPARNIVDHFAEFVLLLGMIAATLSSIAEEISRLMAPEFGEVSERLPPGDVGSSTMPQKRNAKKCMEVVTKSTQIRALVPVALDAMIQSHEVDGARSAMMSTAVDQSAILTGDILTSMHQVLVDLEVYPERMIINVALSKGLINAESVMMALAKAVGRQTAHEVVHEVAQQVATDVTSTTFAHELSKDPRVTAHLSPQEIERLLDSATYTGLSADIARETCARARVVASRNRQLS